ncbi:MAG: ATP-binding cassette domain-containing protein, partial [Oscillospiraceae bacterium]|nr:ATP-binding cassette domain-containing protein [Oscillospiraceae bacterium]
MLKVTNMNVYYGHIHAVKDVSFDVAKGEIVTLIGANGAGKSTILKTISGLLRCSKGGSIFFEDEGIGYMASHAIVKRGLAHVPEGRRVFAQMSVQENLEMGHYTQPNGTMNERMEQVFQKFPRLLERRKQVAGTLSGGE